jgi:two-component system sensor histidine kinase TctE
MRREPGWEVLEVEDNGPGIAPQERARVFERFYRGAEPEGEGSGLGLAIVREIAVSHDAQLVLDIPASGRGLVVRVSFPAAGKAVSAA